MAWSIRWTDQSIRELHRLDRSVAERIVARLEQAAGNPDHFFSRLKARDEHKLRVGDFRVVAVLSRDTKTILVMEVGHRSRVYRKR